MKILIVDDTHIMRVIVKDIFVKHLNVNKNDCFEAPDGRTAINQYKAIEPDLVFLDINLPDLNGIEVVKELKKINGSAKIVMCTSSGDEEDVRGCISAGAGDYLVKPVKPERVINAVKKLMGSSFAVGGADDGGADSAGDSAADSDNQ